MTPLTPLETVLRRDRWLVASSLLVATALCWAWIVPMARDMYGPMTGASAWMMTSHWDAVHLGLLLAMWIVMMTGMMLPSAAPTLLLYACVVRKDGTQPAACIYAFGTGYLVVWGLFSLAATLLQWGLAQSALLSPMMELQNSAGSAVLLLLAGVYQLTPLKRSCLESCRSPVAFITRHWRAGARGAFQLGVTHGWFCLGCCWALMLLLFVGGVMNLWCIGALTFFVLLEKMVPLGGMGGRVIGLLLAGAGLWLLVKR